MEADAYYESIQEEWQQLTGRMVTPAEYRVMQTLRLDGVPLDVVQEVLRDQVPKRGRSKPLAYHRPAILEAHKSRERLAAPAANWEGYEADAPKSWEAECARLVGVARAAVDDALKEGDIAPHVAPKLWQMLVEVEGQGIEKQMWERWREFKEAAPRIVGEIIRRAGA